MQTGKVEITVAMARELAAVVIERDTLLARNAHLYHQLTDAIGDLDLLLYDYKNTVTQLRDLRVRNDALTRSIDRENEHEITYWRRMSRGMHLDINLYSTVSAWDRVVVIPQLGVPVGGKWSLTASGVLGMDMPVSYLVGFGYRVF